jgi:serine/threonine-protein kinase
METEVSARFGQYQLYRQLSTGPVGDAFLAHRVDEPYSAPLALRRIHPEIAASMARELLDEAIFGAQLSHPCLVAVRDFGEAEGTLFFAMEYLHGLSLRGLGERWRAVHPQQPFPWAPLARAGIYLCEAVHYIHTLRDSTGMAGMVHQGLNPSNMMIASNGAVKLLDFGISRDALLKAGRLHPGAFRHLEYAAPEQRAGRPVDPRTDIYSLGLVLYSVLAGVPPSSSARDRRPLGELRRDVPGGLADAIDRAVEPEPRHRPQSMAELRDLIWEPLLERRMVLGLPELADLVNGVFRPA